MEWRFKNAVLGSYEIENSIHTDPNYLDEAGKLFSYVDTSICYNNDLILGNLLSKNKKIKVISKIPPQMTNEYEFMMSNHLRCLKRKKIDIMLIHNPRADWKLLAEMLEKDERVISTGVSNFSINDLEKYRSLIGHYPHYNEIEINPEYYDKDLIEFCNKNEIKIIAYAILGGKYNARRNISTYTLPFLLMLAGRSAEYVILRSDSIGRLKNSLRFLKNINNNDSDDANLYNVFSDNMNKSIVPTAYSKPKVYTRMVFPTNSDQIVLGKLAISNGYTRADNNISDDLGINDITLPKYEFISDYRVYIRYTIDKIIYEKTGDYPCYPYGYYKFPSTYVASSHSKRKLSNLFKKPSGIRVICSVNLLDPNGKLSKVDDGNCKFVIESMLFNI